MTREIGGQPYECAETDGEIRLRRYFPAQKTWVELICPKDAGDNEAKEEVMKVLSEIYVRRVVYGDEP